MTLLLPAGIEVGTATHTGRVRSNNEDDYLVLVPSTTIDGALFIVADGLGGMVGGAEASRAAVRSLATAIEAADPKIDPIERMRNGFDAACLAVSNLARNQPSLRGMATTLTALRVEGDTVVIGHVGDTRCYRLRGGQLDSLTTDHVLQQGGHHLTRCIGGGRDSEQVDAFIDQARPGDTYLLASDGLWNVVAGQAVAQTLQRLDPPEAALKLIRLADLAGGPDNSTAIVIRLSRPEMSATSSVVLPSEEPRLGPQRLLPVPDLQRPRWPWLVLIMAIALLAVAATKEFLQFDVFSEWIRAFRR